MLATCLLVTACGGAGQGSTTTTDPGDPALSGSGYVVWSSIDGLFVRDMDTDEESRIGPAEDTFPSQPTPGPGGRLAWSELTADGGQIAIRDSDGTVTRIDGPTVPFYYSWSPDGELLGFLGNGPRSLIFGIVEDGEARSVDTGAPYYFDWSPDAQSLFVHRVGTDLSVLTLDGERVVVDDSPAVFQAPQWTDEGVIYADAGAGTFASQDIGVLLATTDEPADLVAADAPGEEPTLIVTLSAFSAFDRSGERVAVLSFDSPPTGSLTVIDIATRSATEVATRVVAHRWSPDGQKLLFLRTEESGEGVWAVWEDGAGTTDLVTFIPTRIFVRDYLPFWDQYARSITPWSPDSDAFTFAGQIADEERPGVYVQDLDGTRERLADGAFSAWGRS